MRTARYQNPRLKTGEFAAVRITLGRPRFRLGYQLAGELRELAPSGKLFGIHDRATFEPLYRAKLAAIGFEVTRRQVAAEMEEEGQGPGVSIPRPSIPWRQTPAEPSGVEELERLARLRADDLLTEEEYAAAKARSLQRVGD